MSLAADTGCTVCTGPLATGQVQTCTGCVARYRADLAGITDAYAMLADVAATPSPAWRPDHRRSGEQPIPGGDAMVMLAPGGAGSDQPTRRGDRSHAADEWRSDPPSVIATLSTWEDDVRSVLGDPPAGRATLVQTVGYLSRVADRAAQHHPAFGELAAETRRLLRQIERAAGTDVAVVESPAPCLDTGWGRRCGGRLRKEATDSGMPDEWTCARCGRRYSDVEHRLAVRALWEEAAG